MKVIGTYLLVLAVMSFVVSAAACRRNEQGEGAAEQAGKTIDKGLERAGQETGKLMEKAGEAMQKAGDNLEKKSRPEQGGN